MTIGWYKHFPSGKSAHAKCLEQISAYCAKSGIGPLNTITNHLSPNSSPSISSHRMCPVSI